MEDLFVEKKMASNHKHYNHGKYRKSLPRYNAKLTFYSHSLI